MGGWLARLCRWSDKGWRTSYRWSDTRVGEWSSAHSPTLLLLHLHHSHFTYVTWRAAYAPAVVEHRFTYPARWSYCLSSLVLKLPYWIFGNSWKSDHQPRRFHQFPLPKMKSIKRGFLAQYRYIHSSAALWLNIYDDLPTSRSAATVESPNGYMSKVSQYHNLNHSLRLFNRLQETSESKFLLFWLSAIKV